MPDIKGAIRAYAAASAQRAPREQEADVLRRVNAALRHARGSSNEIERVRALSQNDQLWLTITGLLRDPANQLPVELRARLISVGRSVEREVRRENPDFDFLITINENIAGALDHRAADGRG